MYLVENCEKEGVKTSAIAVFVRTSQPDAPPPAFTAACCSLASAGSNDQRMLITIPATLLSFSKRNNGYFRTLFDVVPGP